ncbi:glycosyltransferase family 4 protein [Rhodopila sp.]|uniref:glycosyltransferase family 4 protein n=1 Tax=Rhodopila sp. TaxID=2480087 RepID=UPI002D1B7B09|nr:glycosyltransferase family 4 protein [Rhodopila sp.]HVZ07488.1 glycosyltransferase family 4 protein [Rhodopila sp.]
MLLTLDAVGGIWHYALDVAAALSQRGGSCLLVGFGPPPDAVQRAACENLAAIDLAWTHLPLDWLADGEDALHEADAALLSLARDWQAELLHLNLPSQAACVPLGWPVVVTSHSCLPSWWRAMYGTPLPLDWQWHWQRNQQGLRRADAIMVPSASHGAALCAVYGSVAGLRVVPNATQPASPRAGPRMPVVLAAGRWWDEAKNAAVLDAAAPDMAWPVLLAGPLAGPDGSRVGLDHVHTLGALPRIELLALMDQAAIFAAPSRYEPFGLAVLEAALRGAALVLADIPGFRELWGEAALFVDPGDAMNWAATCNSLATDPTRLAMWADRAYRRARHFTPARQIKGLLAAYEAACLGAAAEPA